MRGQLPPVRTDLSGLLEFTRNNLDTFWRGAIEQSGNAGIEVVGRNDYSIAMVTLGPALFHHSPATH